MIKHYPVIRERHVAEKVYKLWVSLSKTPCYLLPATAARATSPDHLNKMASSLHFIAVLCLTSGLWTAANAAECKLCPPGWTHYEQKCYLFSFDVKDFVDAEIFCVSHGGNLASLHTPEEYQFLRDTIKGETSSNVETWVGGYDSSKEGVWLWTDGSKFDDKYWTAGQPSNSGGNEHCMEINLDGEDKTNDIPCDLKRSFVCVKEV